MSARSHPDALAACVDDVWAGRRSVQACLASHPAEADELRALLEVARAIGPPPPLGPDPAFRLRARVALVEAIHAEQQAVTGRRFRHFLAAIAGLPRPVRTPLRRETVPALLLAFLIALGAAGGGAVYASQDALPGDALYPVKLRAEGLQLALAASDEGRARTHLELAARRIAEIQTAHASGRTAAVAAAAAAFADDVAAADEGLTTAVASGKDVTALTARLSANLSRQQAVLKGVQATAPDEATGALTKAAAAAERGLTTAAARVQPAGPAGGGPGTAPTPAAAAPESRPTHPADRPAETPANARPTAGHTPEAEPPERVSALVAAARAGDAQTVRELAAALADDVHNDVDGLDRTDEANRPALAAQLIANLVRLRARLQEVVDQAPAEARPALARALELTEQGLVRARQATGGPHPTPHATARPTGIPAPPRAVEPTRTPPAAVVPPAVPTPRSENPPAVPTAASGAGSSQPPAAAPAASAAPATPAQPAQPATQQSQPANPAQAAAPAQPAQLPSPPAPAPGAPPKPAPPAPSAGKR
ncbi:MAG TPA: DUF5667 domain-containing protein [Chloroflexota bacterium]